MVQRDKVTYQQIKDSEEDPEGNQIRHGQRTVPATKPSAIAAAPTVCPEGNSGRRKSGYWP